MIKLATLSRRSLLAGAAVLAAAGLLPLAAHAQAGTVKFILPNATGSGVDAITRAAQPALSKALGASMVVENQPGAGGVLGLQALARSAADGNTLSVVSNNVVIFPSVLKSLPFDMPGDFTPIAVVGATPMVLVVNPAKMAASNHKEFLALLKAKPDGYNFASGGNGTILHLATELYLDAAGAKAKHIPYKGVGPMVNDLLGGQVDFATAARHRHAGAAAHAGRAGDRDLRRTGPGQLRGGGLVRGDRPQSHEPGCGEEGARRGRCRLQ